jgi:hypothetical protein
MEIPNLLILKMHRHQSPFWLVFLSLAAWLTGCGVGMRIYSRLLTLNPISDFSLTAFGLVKTSLEYTYSGTGTVSLECQDCPSGMMVESNPDELHWIPTPGKEGSYTIHIKALSSSGESDYIVVNVSVAPTNYILVNTTAHEPVPIANGNCTLVEAILAANTAAPVDGCVAGDASGTTYIYVPSGTYHLTSAYSGFHGYPPITARVRIVGDGIGSTIIQRSNDSLTAVRGSTAPAFWLFASSSGSLELLNLSLVGGSTAVVLAGGTGLLSHVLIDQSSVTADGGYGGAVRVTGTTSTMVQRTQFTNNSGHCWGGALQTFSGSTTISSCYFSGNSVSDGCGLGGAVHVESGSTENIVEYSTFTNNSASWGGQLVTAGTAPLILRDSTFTNGPNGGITLLGSGPKTITRTTISGGVWYGLLTGDYTGVGSTINISDSTFSDNPATALASQQTSSVVTLSNVNFFRNAGNPPLSNQYGSMSLLGGSFKDNVAGQAFDVVLNDGTTGANLNSPSNVGNLLDFPVLVSATVLGSNLEVTGYVGAGIQVQLFYSDSSQTIWGHGETRIAKFTEGSSDDLDSGSTSYGPTVGGVTVGTGTANNFRVLIPLYSLPSSYSGRSLTALGTLGAVTSEFSNVVTIQ